MQHFPIFVNLAGRRVVLAGGGEAALAKLRLLLKTEAHLSVFSTAPDPQIEAWAREGKLALHTRDMAPGDALCAVLAYAADEDPQRDARTAALARADGAMVNIVDNLEDSAFITPAIVDRDPVCVAIGTEGAAPVLARAIKRDLEEKLPRGLGPLARIGKAFRRAADALPKGASGAISGLTGTFPLAPKPWMPVAKPTHKAPCAVCWTATPTSRRAAAPSRSWAQGRVIQNS